MKSLLPAVPIAFPLIAGAGTLSAIILLRAEYQTANVIVGIVINLILIYQLSVRPVLQIETNKIVRTAGIRLPKRAGLRPEQGLSR